MPSAWTVEAEQPIYEVHPPFAREDVDQRIYRFISPSGPFDFRGRVQNRRVMPAFVELANLREASRARMPSRDTSTPAG